MLEENTAFDDFVDDCFIEEDPICGLNGEKSLELVASTLISELISEDDNTMAA